MPIDVDGLTVLTVTREIGNVVLAIEFLHSAQDRVERPVEHEVGDVPLRQFELFVWRAGVTEVEGMARSHSDVG